jgi:hypothetical protein
MQNGINTSTIVATLNTCSADVFGRTGHWSTMHYCPIITTIGRTRASRIWTSSPFVTGNLLHLPWMMNSPCGITSCCRFLQAHTALSDLEVAPEGVQYILSLLLTVALCKLSELAAFIVSQFLERGSGLCLAATPSGYRIFNAFSTLALC